MGNPRSAGPAIALSLVGAAVFTGGLLAYINHSIDEARATATAEAKANLVTPTSAPERTSLDAASELATRFAQALAAKSYADAYGLMAPAYRSTFTLEDFAATCGGSPFLSTLARATVVSTRRTKPPDSVATSYTLQARGVLVTTSGELEASYTFWVERERMYLLVLTIAGVPVLDGVSGKPR